MTKQIDIDLMKSLFDYKNGELFWKIDRGAKKVKGLKAGYISNGYKSVLIRPKNYLIHRIIFLLHYGFCPKVIDHIDGNRLNNKIENLRMATFSENQANYKKRSTNTSGNKNVYFYIKRNKWRAQVRFEKKTFAKDFEDYKDAVNFAKILREKHHGEFANG
jgi:hypothetical protein